MHNRNDVIDADDDDDDDDYLIYIVGASLR